MTFRAVANSDLSRSISLRSRAASFCPALAGGAPAGRPSACKAPASRWSRQALISDVYKPSRRSNAPLATRSHASYCARMSLLYFAVYVRRLARSGTCGSGTSPVTTDSTADGCAVIVVLIKGNSFPAL